MVQALRQSFTHDMDQLADGSGTCDRFVFDSMGGSGFDNDRLIKGIAFQVERRSDLDVKDDMLEDFGLETALQVVDCTSHVGKVKTVDFQHLVHDVRVYIRNAFPSEVSFVTELREVSTSLNLVFGLSRHLLEFFA